MGVTLSKEQAYRIASSLVISDIVSYCKTHPKEYENELRNQYQKGNISLQQFEKEIAIIKTYYEEVRNVDAGRIEEKTTMDKLGV